MRAECFNLMGHIGFIDALSWPVGGIPQGLGIFWVALSKGPSKSLLIYIWNVSMIKFGIKIQVFKLYDVKNTFEYAEKAMMWCRIE